MERVPMWLMMLGALLFFISPNVYAVSKNYSGENYQIIISGFKFNPETLSVIEGDTITWVNQDIVPHQIASATEQGPNSIEFKKGQKYVFVVKQSFVYDCNLHPSMKGRVLVKNASKN